MSDSLFNNKMLKAKNPGVNIDKMLTCFKKKFAEIEKIQGPEDLVVIRSLQFIITLERKMKMYLKE